MNQLNVVLVASKYPRNVGLVSRILSNYGVERLILVRPQCEMDHEAHQGAAQGQGPLENITVYKTWDEFYRTEPDGLRVGFSRRRGKRRVSAPYSDLLRDSEMSTEQPIYFFFGAEDHGLSNEDLDMVHRTTHFELPGPLQSMNLSHSVLVAVDQFYGTLKAANARPEPQRNQRPSTEAILDPEPFLKLWLQTLNFDLESQNRWNALTMMKQLVMRARPSNEELKKFEMIVRQTVRKLNETDSSD